MEPLTTSAIFAGISAAFRFAEYGIRIAEVGTENEVFVRTIEVVRNTLGETERLLSIRGVQAKLFNTPSKLEWIKNALFSTKSALNEIGKWVERPRNQLETHGTVKFETRVRWIFNDHEKLVNRQAELSACHQQLSTVLNYLIPLEDAVSDSVVFDNDDTSSFNNYISPRQRRRFTDKALGKRPLSEQALMTLNRVNERSKSANEITALGSTTSLPGTQIGGPNYFSGLMSPPQSVASLDTISTPPPRYSSVALSEPSPSRDPEITAGSSRHIGSSNGKSSDIKDQDEVWRHEYPTVPEQAPPGSPSSSFSGTNYQGPVDPFEMLADVPKRPSPRAQRASSLGMLELLGDTTHPSELPGTIPNVVHHNSAPISNTFLSPHMPSKVVPKRRPVQSRAGATTSYLLSSDNAKFSTSLDSLSTSKDTVQSLPGQFELPGSQCIPYRPRNVHTRTSSSVSSIPSISSPPSSPPTHIPKSTSSPQKDPSARRPITPSSSQVEVTMPPPSITDTTRKKETIASDRMKSQKAFMEMLASIEER